jgi:hypothetical protein
MKSLSRLMTPEQLIRANYGIDIGVPQPQETVRDKEEEASNAIVP